MHHVFYSINPKISPAASPAKSGWLLIVLNILRCSTLNSLKLEMIMSSRGKRPTSFGWLVDIWFCSACINISCSLFTFSRLLRPERSTTNLWQKNQKMLDEIFWWVCFSLLYHRLTVNKLWIYMDPHERHQLISKINFYRPQTKFRAR